MILKCSHAALRARLLLYIANAQIKLMRNKQPGIKFYSIKIIRTQNHIQDIALQLCLMLALPNVTRTNKDNALCALLDICWQRDEHSKTFSIQNTLYHLHSRTKEPRHRYHGRLSALLLYTRCCRNLERLGHGKRCNRQTSTSNIARNRCGHRPSWPGLGCCLVNQQYILWPLLLTGPG